MQKEKKSNFPESWRHIEANLLGFVLSILRNKQDAEHLVQELTIVAYLSFDEFNDPNQLHGWIFRLAKWRSIDFLRKTSREHKVKGQLPTEATYVEQPISDPFIHKAIHTAIANLPEMQKEIMSRFVNGQSPKIISEDLKIAESTVRSHLRFARQKISDKILHNLER